LTQPVGPSDKRRIAAGEVRQSHKEIAIAKRGRAVAGLVPADEELPPVFGRMRDSAEILGDIVAPIGEKWSADE
jgi:antitoxin (DNA-binding transcriptional repressor) of toxin-antitoxin stability system